MLNHLMSWTTSIPTTTTSSVSDESIFAALFGMLAVMWIFVIALYVVAIIGMWKMFVKAGREGWKALIPLYNLYVITEISGQNGLLFLLVFIPGVGALIWSIMVALKLAPAFGKGTGFAIGLILFPWLFYLILGFSKDQYVLGRPAGAAAPVAGAAPQGPAPQAQPQVQPQDPWITGQQQ